MVLQSADGARHHSAPMLFGLRAVMLGRQGSGKGTQGLQLARLLVVPHISVGDVLREAVRSASHAGRRAQETMERGELVDDDLVVSLVAERLASADVRSGGFVLDGFPRTVEQAEALTGMLADGTLDRAVVDAPAQRDTSLLRRYKALEPGKSTSTTGFEGREAALGEIAASRARLAHQQRTGAAARQDVPREPAPAAGGLPVDAVA